MKKDNTERTFESILSRKLAEAEIAPPDDLWSRIEHKRKNTRRLIFLRVAATLVLFLGSAYLIHLMISESPIETASNNDTVIEVKSTSLKEQILEISESQPNDDNGSENMIAMAVAYEIQPETEFKKIDLTTTNISSDITHADNQSGNDGDPEIDEEEEQAVENKTINTKIVLLPDNFEYELPKEKKSVQKWSVGLAYGSNIDRGPAAQNGPQRLTNSSFGFDEFQGELAFETVYFQQIENTSFEPPFSIGALVNLPITNRFRLEAGLFYTLLAHESRTMVINNKQSVFNTRLHYLGIPVGIQWIIINGRVIRFYVSQSLVIEKGLSAEYSADRYEKGRFQKTEQSREEIRGVQLSGNSSIGMEFSLPQNFALFGQAGVQVYLMNKTQPFNLRSEHMIWPAVQTGIRWRIAN